MTVKVSDMDNETLSQTSSTLAGGAFYKDLSGCVNEEIWLCPVTLFVLGRYPKNIQIAKEKGGSSLDIKRSALHICDGV